LILAAVDHPGQTRAARPAADSGGHHHLVSRLQTGDGAAHLHHFAHGFMADAKADIFGKTMAVINVQIAAADRTAGHLDDGIAFRFQLGIIHVFVADVPRAIIAKGFHASSPRSSRHPREDGGPRTQQSFV
jgi:hypothetical protein